MITNLLKSVIEVCGSPVRRDSFTWEDKVIDHLFMLDRAIEAGIIGRDEYNRLIFEVNRCGFDPNHGIGEKGEKACCHLPIFP